MVDTFGTGAVPDELLERWIEDNFDLRPGAIIDKLQLRRPIYATTSVYGHFGKCFEEHTWEVIDTSLIASLNNLKAEYRRSLIK